MIDATSNKSSINSTEDKNQNENPPDSNTNVTAENSEKSESKEQNQVLIKTETRTGYVNIDGTERDKIKNESNLKDILKDRINSYYNNTSNINDGKQTQISPSEEVLSSMELAAKPVEVDDIIVPQKPQEPERLQPPSSTKAKDVFKLLPKVLQDFLNSEWKTKSKCEPQHLLERIRKEKRYPDHPDVDKYELLLTPAPSFLQRISLAGEFLTKKQLEM